MKNKQRLIYTTLLLFLVYISACKKEEVEVQTVPVLAATTVSDIGYFTAVGSGTITSNGGDGVLSYGVCWDTEPDPTVENSKAVASGKSSTGEFTVSLANLQDSTVYYARAFATNSLGTAYGEQVSFTTASALPALAATTISDISYYAATANAKLMHEGGGAIQTYGFCWSTQPSPTIENNKTDGSDRNEAGEFSGSLSDLQDNTLYYVRSFATNQTGTAYGEEVSFTTAQVTLPTVTTSAISNIAVTTASGGGEVTATGGAALTGIGICWSSSPNPTIADKRVTFSINSGDGTGAYTGNIHSLVRGTKYYVRAYATNKAGTAYGNEVSFTTSSATGNITYTLVKAANPTADQLAAYARITAAMDAAVEYYNMNTTFTKVLRVEYNPGVQTADGNFNGTIRFGSNAGFQRTRTALHEIAHTLGVGTHWRWAQQLIVGGIYQGAHATAALREISGNPNDVLKGDTQHFWPHGLNSDSEGTSASHFLNHCKILEAMKKDGLGQ